MTESPKAPDRPLQPLPSGSVTFLFTDVEGSTRLFHRLGELFPGVLEEHRAILREAFASHGGVEVKTEGDGFFVAFGDPARAVAACLDAQRGLAAHEWPADCQVRVRMGLHSGEATPSPERDYLDLAVNQAARIAAAGHGGQVLVSEQTADLVRDALPSEAALADVGRFMLKDFDEPERIFQLVHPSLDASFPSLRASPALSHNLPDVRTSFIGRDAELHELSGLLETNRLVSVVGPGGAGKTRLSVELGARLAARFASGVRLSDLSPLADPELVRRTIAAAFGVREVPGSDPLEAVARELAGHDALLILDNCEHVLDAAASAVDALLSTASGLRVLATSREPLGLPGEQVWRVSPLAVPDAGAGPEAVLQIESGRLFADRARLAQPRFTVNQENATAIAAICRQLEGLPLALELAAARVAVLSPAAIATRLTDRIQVLSGGSKRATGRHRTLEATIDWSYQLLDEEERQLLRSLAAFAGGFTVDAVEAISEADPLETLGGLVDKSLVVWDPDGERYRLLETIRTFAGARLDESGERETVADRHLAWFAGWAEAIEPQTYGADQRPAFDRIDAELDNLRAAVAWAETRDPGQGLRIPGPLVNYWDYRGALAEGRLWIERLMPAAANAPAAVQGKALRALAVTMWRMGDFESSYETGRRAMELLRPDQNRALLGALMAVGGAASALDRFDESRQAHLEARELATRLGDRGAQGTATSNLGEVERMAGNFELAERYAEEAYALNDARTAPTVRAFTTLNLAYAKLVNGRDAASVTALFREALDLAVKANSPMIVAWNLDGLAQAIAPLDPERSAELLGAATALRLTHRVELDPQDQADVDAVRGGLVDRLGADRVAQLMDSVGEPSLATAAELARSAARLAEEGE